MAKIETLQRQLNSMLRKRSGTSAADDARLAAGEAPALPPVFSPFIREHLKRAIALANSFMMLANQEGGAEGLAAVLGEARRLEATENTELVQYALMVFITHHPQGSRLKILSLEERAPERVLSSAPIDGASLAAGTPTEADLNWFREDAWANDHHDHWHLVYPGDGIPDGSADPPLKERHGELFFYMHQQMLARYDTERVAVGLSKVKSFSDYGEAIQEGYDPGIQPELVSSPNSPTTRRYSARPSGVRLSDINRPDLGFYGVNAHATFRDRLQQAVQTGRFSENGNTAPVDAVSLGATVEPTKGTFSDSEYGNHHGMGHVLISASHDPTGVSAPGVMLYVDTAIRDPIFYRWHRHIDDFLFKWQEAQPPNDFSDSPPVLIRDGLGAASPANSSPDIILCYRKAIRGARSAGFDGQAFGESAFGGANWDRDFSMGGVCTNELQTKMLQREVRLRDGTRKLIPYLDQEEFFYFLRVENKSNNVQNVTVRIFLAAEELANDRRMWVEMDKFLHKLQPRQKGVIFRPAALSSVIRKPGLKPPRPVRRRTSTSPVNQENYCNCGWPYNLLLPRGRMQGMKFRIFVMLTNNDEVQQTECGSMSFCGVRTRYPDKRSMGYPFDRPFPATRSIAQTVTVQENIATRDFTIRLLNLVP